MEILNECSDVDEIKFQEDGSWCPMRPKKEAVKVSSPQCTKIESTYIWGAGCKPTKSLGDLAVACIMCMDVDVCVVEGLILLTFFLFTLNDKGCISQIVPFLGLCLCSL